MFALIWVAVVNLTGMPSGMPLTEYIVSLLDPVSAVGGLSFSLAWGLGVPETIAIGLGWLSLFIAAAIGAWFGKKQANN